MRHKFITLILFILLFTTELFAQGQQTEENNNHYIAAGVIIGIAGMFLVLLVFSNRIHSIAEKNTVKGESLFRKLRKKLSGAVPLEKEKDIMLDHDFDGIKELDNSIPPWFNILFYGTIVIALLYMLNYHVFKFSPLSAEEYSDEIRIATEQRNELIRTGAFINENTVKLLHDETILSEGKNIFATNCSSCHGMQGGGLIGPNLTDEYWLHGGGIINVFKTVKYGVPVKGMISWQTQLNPKQIQSVANYILSLKGSNPSNPKQPEGLIYIDSSSAKNDSVKAK